MFGYVVHYWHCVLFGWIHTRDMRMQWRRSSHFSNRIFWFSTPGFAKTFPLNELNWKWVIQSWITYYVHRAQYYFDIYVCTGMVLTSSNTVTFLNCCLHYLNQIYKIKRTVYMTRQPLCTRCLYVVVNANLYRNFSKRQGKEMNKLLLLLLLLLMFSAILNLLSYLRLSVIH